MNNHLRCQLSFAWPFLILCSITTLGQAVNKSDTSPTIAGKAAPVAASGPVVSTQTTPNAVDALRSGKLIYVTSSSLLVGASVIEEKLQKRPEFQLMGLMITRDAEVADIILEVHHDLFTKYVYSAVDPRNRLVIASGKLSSLGGTVAGKVAKRFLKQILRARQSQPTS